MNDFWQKQKEQHSQGLVVLAPMADVTDNPFRKILSEIGPPDIYWNEFVSADGLAHSEARPILEYMLTYEADQRPIIAQIFSGNPQNCQEAARLCQTHGFDGVDLNMGCPVRNILKQVSGAELTKREHRERVTQIISQTREGAGELPVSVKTRLGFHQIDISWIRFLLTHNLPCLTLHLRTRKEMSQASAHWELLDEIIALKRRLAPETILIANGDVSNRTEAGERMRQHPGLDGVMIGRGVLQNPWAFAQDCCAPHTPHERMSLALRHTQYFLHHYPREEVPTKSFNLMKKFFKCYINGFAGAKELRNELMACRTPQEVQQVGESFLGQEGDC